MPQAIFEQGQIGEGHAWQPCINLQNKLRTPTNEMRLSLAIAAVLG